MTVKQELFIPDISLGNAASSVCVLQSHHYGPG